MAATVEIPVLLTTPGNDAAYFDLTTNNGYSNTRLWIPIFPDGSTGTVQGTVRVPQNYASAGVIICRFAANATSGAYNVRVSTLAATTAEASDAAYSAESFQSITTSGTAKTMKDTTFPSAGTLASTPAAGDTLFVKVERDGAGASGTDSMTVNLQLIECVFRYTTT